jgi:putative hemolysin
MSQRTRLISSFLLLAVLLAACGSPSSTPSPTATPQTPPTMATTQQPVANLPNPASESCVKQGGTLSIQKNSDGSEYGLCIFPDGKQCEEWALQRGECPAGGIPVAGRYTAQLSAVDAIERVVTLELLPNNTAIMAIQYVGKGAPTVDKGTWAQPGKDIVVTIDAPASDKQALTFAYDKGVLVSQGSGEALKLTRTPSGNTHTAEFGGVKIAFDDQLAKSAQGETVAAIPVTEGSVMGGAAPTAIRFLFDGAQAENFTNPRLPQVLIYKTDEWAKIDPLFAQYIDELKSLLAAKPAVITGSIPVLPPIPAAQVFHVKPQYLDFKNGSGVGFVTYYSQAVNPITAKDLFYTFQGLTSDGQYYVTVYSPVDTTLLPEQANMDSAAYEEFAKNYEKFLADLVAQLNALLPAAYTPDLVLVDELVKSIEIGAASR